MVPFLTIAKKTETPREKYENTPQMHHLKFFSSLKPFMSQKISMVILHAVQPQAPIFLI